MPKLVAEGLTKAEMERMIEMAKTKVKDDPERGVVVGPVLCWEKVQMKVGEKNIL
jgi:hypothetical protein